MSFFEPPPPPPEPPVRYEPPEWAGPGENVLPGVFQLEVVLVRTESLAIQVHSGRAYPTGFEFTFALRRREARTGRHDDPIVRWHESTAVIADEVLRFGVELADGRKATVFDRFRHRGDDDPPPDVVLAQRGGGGGSHLWEVKFWSWPLPPPGPFAFVVEWPSEGIPLTRTEIDTEPIRDAAARAEELWPRDGAAGGGWSSSTSTFHRRSS
jgi:hypothetical protein